MIPHGPHSAIPVLDELPADLWERPSPLRGIRFDRDDQVRRLHALEQWLHEFRPPPRFQLWNRFYEAFDAEVLWALLRQLRPRRVVELGSGWSSLIIAAALEANRDGAIYEAYDPFPREPAPSAVQRLRAQDVPEATFAALTDRDVLFVDTTHTVKIAGDVNRIVLDVLPMLAPGVVVHFHDVLLPWEVHRRWLERGWFWCEQYLLQAFLSGNRDWEVLLGLHDLTRTQPELVRRMVPSWRGDSYPSAFWIRRVT